MALAASSTQLSCGRDIDQVWDHLDQAPDAHERTCRYCQAARADLAGLADATQSMRDDDATNPDSALSPGVLDRILAVAYAEVRRGRRLPLDQPTSDQTSANTVSEQAVTAVVWRAGDRTNHVQIRRCSHTLVTTANTSIPTAGIPADPNAQNLPGGAQLDAGPAATAVRLSLQVSVGNGLAIADASNQLRLEVIEAVRQEIGMDVVSVDIAVEDVHDA